MNNFFSLKGRIDRTGFLFGLLVVYTLITIFGICMSLDETAGKISLVLFIPAIWISIVTQVKRLHDINQSGWWILLDLINPAGLVLTLILLFKKGDKETNKYGYPTL